MSQTIRIFGLAPDSIVDGPGLRFTVFVQGCPHDCPGCHNPESHDMSGGSEMAIDEVWAQIDKNPLLTGLTISGGEPFEQAAACAELAKRARNKGLNVWVYSGYLYEDLADRDDPDTKALLKYADVLVDGPYVESLRSLDLPWRGSENQRMIDLR